MSLAAFVMICGLYKNHITLCASQTETNVSQTREDCIKKSKDMISQGEYAFYYMGVKKPYKTKVRCLER